MLFRRLRERRRRKLAERAENATHVARPDASRTRIRSFLSGQRD
jgi:hypothetical protein